MLALNQMTNAELENFILNLRRKEREIQIDFIVGLAEIDSRKMFLDEGYPSLFAYVTKKLGYSEASAQKRIQLARYGLKFPELIARIKSGKMHVSGASAIAPHLTIENQDELLKRMENKTLDEIRWIVVEYRPKALVSDAIRLEKTDNVAIVDEKSHSPIKVTIQPSKSLQELKPATSERATIRFSCSKEFVATLKRCQELLQSTGETDFEHVFQKTMKPFLEKRDPQKRQERREEKEKMKEEVKRENVKPSQIKSARVAISLRTRDLVFKINKHQCNFKSAEGVRCSARAGLQVDHKKSVCHGGENNLENLQLLCSAHHRQKTERQLGAAFMENIKPTNTQRDLHTQYFRAI